MINACMTTILNDSHAFDSMDNMDIEQAMLYHKKSLQERDVEDLAMEMNKEIHGINYYIETPWEINPIDVFFKQWCFDVSLGLMMSSAIQHVIKVGLWMAGHHLCDVLKHEYVKAMESKTMLYYFEQREIYGVYA